MAKSPAYLPYYTDWDEINSRDHDLYNKWTAPATAGPQIKGNLGLLGISIVFTQASTPWNVNHWSLIEPFYTNLRINLKST